ncbi:MAG: hypothetical protein Q9191_007088 [Dirinaria sp. TL-2023a]
MGATRSPPIGNLFEQTIQQQAREANLRARENHEPPWRRELEEIRPALHGILRARFAPLDRETNDLGRPHSYMSGIRTWQCTEMSELDISSPEEQSFPAMLTSHRFTGEAELSAYEEQQPVSDFTRDRSINDAESPTNSAHWSSAREGTEIAELDTGPSYAEGRSSTAMPTSQRLTGESALHAYEEQPVASGIEVSALYDRVIPPEAPSADATAADFQAHIERLEADLRAADRRIEILETEQSEIRQSYIQAMSRGQEAELSGLKRKVDAFKESLEEAHRDRDTLQRELRESRTRELELEERLHGADLENVHLAAEVGRLRLGTGASDRGNVRLPRTQSPPEERIPERRVWLDGRFHRANLDQTYPADEAERLSNTSSYTDTVRVLPPSSRLDEREMPRGGGRPCRTSAEWNFPKGQVPWFQLIFLP